MRVAGELSEAVQRAEIEAQEDLGHSVTGNLRLLQDLGEPDAVNPFGHQHASPAEAGDDIGDENERVAAPPPREDALRLRLVLIVELLADALAQFDRRRRWVKPGSKSPGRAQDQTEVLEIGAHGGSGAGVLHLDGDGAAVMQTGTVDLPDRRRGDG